MSSPCPRPAGSLDEDGDIIPASYMNFYIGNAAVVVPQYGAPNDKAAVDAVQALFPDRVAIGLRADHILTGGGSFHCISANRSPHDQAHRRRAAARLHRRHRREYPRRRRARA